MYGGGNFNLRTYASNWEQVTIRKLFLLPLATHLEIVYFIVELTSKEIEWKSKGYVCD